MSDNHDTSQNECKLDSCLFFSTTKLARTFSKIADDAFSKTGLSPNHALILYIVNLNGNIHQKEIGERLHLTPSTITRFIEKLEMKKLVTRNISGKNVYICTTEAGLALQSEIMKAWSNLHDKYQGILSNDEVEQLITINNKLLSKLDNKVE